MPKFDHERLIVYQRAIEFVAWSSPIIEALPKSLAVRSQFDRASTSLVLNLAEGNGKHTAADRCRFFYISRGSALESAACLDVLVVKKLIGDGQVMEGKAMLVDIVSMIVGLIRANSESRSV